MELILSNVEPRHKKVFSEIARALNVGVKELNTKNMLLVEIEESLKEVKQMQAGTKAKRNFSDLLNDLENAQ